ncbi:MULTISPECIES: hypothetical protein [unclassified Streptomyces]|uniref:hypothetical protein n=1 Tax=unclassified Streptomyces TaxID=2593676 RepID=UPI0033B46DFD
MTLLPLPGGQGDDLPDWVNVTLADLVAREERALAHQKRRVRQMRRERRRQMRLELRLRVRRGSIRSVRVYGRPAMLWTGTTSFVISMVLLLCGEHATAMELLKVAVAAWTVFVAIPPRS